MEERIEEILEMYNACFKDLDCSPINPGEFVEEFNINLELIKESLISMDRKIYHQRQVVRELIKTYPNNKENLQELWKRLHNVHKEIYETLREDLGVCECWIDSEKDEVEYSIAP